MTYKHTDGINGYTYDLFILMWIDGCEIAVLSGLNLLLNCTFMFYDDCNQKKKKKRWEGIKPPCLVFTPRVFAPDLNRVFVKI